MDLANWALRTSLKFTTGVKYQFPQVCFFNQIRDPKIPITLRPPVYTLKFLHAIYESADYDLTQGFFYSCHWDFRISDLVKNPDGTDI